MHSTGRFFCAVAAVCTGVLINLSPAFAGAPDEFDGDLWLGRAIFKLKPGTIINAPIEPGQTTGISNLDNLLIRINFKRIERKFPFARPPRPGGTDLTNIYTVLFEPEISVQSVVNDLSKLDEVLYAQPWFINYLFMDHNDEFRDRQYYLDLVQANLAHDYNTGSREVVIAIVDNGTQPDHPDLEGNVWLNPGEDLNGNGRIDDNERNGEDDDENGMVDDFIGWDFPGDDNNPDDDANHGHGTHVAGLASAVTNNRIGIASTAYSCALMLVRTGTGRAITHGYEGIAYAAGTGAHIINNSWGGGRAGQMERDVVAAAWEAGALVVCAAGNNGSASPIYPAGFEQSFAVAATDRNDRKAGWSNYGAWVEISAPGVACYSTTVRGSYTSMDGTSMASPIVASVAALIKSEYPDFTNEQLWLALEFGADNIDEENPNYRGQLGAGRVNAVRSLRAIEYPILNLQELEISLDDNRNGKLDPDESANMVFSVHNMGQPTEEGRAVLTTEDEDIAIISGELDLPEIGSGEVFRNVANPFVVRVARDIIPHTAEFQLHLTAQPGDLNIIRRYEFLIGHPAVLLVDDDDGESYEQIIGDALRMQHLGYQRWDVLANDTPSFEVLGDHEIVVWITGDAFPPLDDDDRWSMEIALRDGANIFLMGKWIGDMRENQPFLRQNFFAYHDDDSVAAEYVVGLEGERPIIPADVRIQLFDPDQAPEDSSHDARISPSGIRPRLTAQPLANYEFGGRVTGTAGVTNYNRETGAHTAYIGFNLEQATDLATPRQRMVAFIMDWMTDYQSAPQDGRLLIPQTPMLEPVRPNPFNGITLVQIWLPRTAPVRLAVYDPAGRLVRTIADGEFSSGTHHFVWNAAGTAAGTYFVRLDRPDGSGGLQQVTLIK